MKRTAEIVMGVIGLILNALMLLFGLFTISLRGNDKFQQSLQQTTIEGSISSKDIDDINHFITSGGWILVAASIIGLILGLIAVFFIKGNKKPKAAGVLFIAGCVLTTLISSGVGFVPAVLYLIAGILSLTRKPKINASA
ncbi:cytochrome bd-type quinol oxidase subunit 2 [Scopulibacillus daqui]|uniref:Cytochrome bd-type quinol oxidase subunit 2 n=1 Tax=Scopulibacillus daqui TaxID=1469162 RepID=A0ABS2Q3E1_9BACL|nr:DUF4064 domain-containing protein [Scopulibacillus daqui]MBM7646824.1 cytochrome bd-type quinol oxidase subunit 2 [Scopulibacillus daqui]